VTCPCGAGPSLDVCCGPFIRGQTQPETAEQLMRSRYSAYTEQAIDYILGTHDPEVDDDVDRESTERWAAESEWLGLEIIDTKAGGAGEERGEVEFVARYRFQGADAEHHERATFRRIDGNWRYVNGEMVKPRPVVRDKPRVGRNELCPCGSGKKYKRCCG
jgi:SEC-C motif domain protein